MISLNLRLKMKILKNQKGFTLLELMIASAMGLLLIGTIAGVVKYQGNAFVLQNQLNKMQANGRGATEFLSRAVQNAGYNVFRGSRFLAASDHYISTVFDEDDDGVIQDNEVITFALGNSSGTPNETFNIKAYFDQDGNGEVDGTEWNTFPIAMNLTAPPYNIYKVIPNNSGTTSKHILARNIDNLVIRYYDKDGNPLPTGVAVDGDGLPIPPYDFSADLSELNEIRKVDMQILARTKDPNPRETVLNSGTYLSGSVAELAMGPTYSDRYHRQTFTANQAPRNLVVAPWGKMEVKANPLTINCPVSTATITATLVDSLGEPVPSGTPINFATSDGGIVSPLTDTTNSFGEAVSVVTYGWESPTASVTVSANASILDNGKNYPVFSSGRAQFQSGDSGSFVDNFTGGKDPNWEELGIQGNIVDWDQAGDGVLNSLLMFSLGDLTHAVNGCNWQQYQVEFQIIQNIDLPFGGFVGGYIRFFDENNNYRIVITRQPMGNCVLNDLKDYCLNIIYWNGTASTLLGRIGVDFNPEVNYKLLAQADGDTIRAKFWNADALGVEDPTPNIWAVEVQDSNISSGKIGFLGNWNNGQLVLFDNIIVSPIG